MIMTEALRQNVNQAVIVLISKLVSATVFSSHAGAKWEATKEPHAYFVGGSVL